MQRERVLDYRVLADSLPQIVWLAGTDGKAEYMNARWYEYTGADATASMYEGWRACVHPDDLSDVLAKRDITLRNGTPYENQMRIRGADGTYRWFLARSVPLRDDEGAISSWLGTCTDIETQKHAEHLLRLLAQTGRALNESLDREVLAHNTARVMVPDYADYVQIFCISGSELQPLAIVHSDPAIAVALQENAVRWPLDMGAPAVAALFAGAKAVVTAEITATMLALEARDAEQLAVLERIAPRSTIAVPLIARGMPCGLLSMAFARTSDRRYGSQDLSVADELGRRLAVSLDNASRFAREHHIATTLQEAMLPPALPNVTGLQLRSTYIAGEGELQVGGDWFDAFALPDGKIAISIGDVTGHGLDAAVVMGEIRQSVRSAAIEALTPLQVLDHADRALRLGHPETIATAGFAQYDPQTRELIYAQAGHPPPIVCYRDGRIEELLASGLPLGMHDLYEGATVTRRLEPGALLVLYTDGLTEFSRNSELGERALREAVLLEMRERSANPALSIYRHVVTENATHADDTAILTLFVE